MTKKKSPRRDLLQAASLIKRGEQAAAMEIYAKILEQFPENRPAQAAIRSLESVKQTSPSISNQWKPEYESILELHNQGHAPQVVSRARIATEKFDSVMNSGRSWGSPASGREIQLSEIGFPKSR